MNARAVAGRAERRHEEPGGQRQHGRLFRPIVTQISRWDRLKGFKPLLEGFLRLKERAGVIAAGTRRRLRLETVRLVMAGAEPAGVADDPEAQKCCSS